jgi:nicotinamidase-related amidase
MELDYNKTAVLLIDLQRDFLEKTGRLPVSPEDADAVIRVANRLVEHAGKKGWTPVFIKNEFSPSDWLGNALRNKSALAGSPGAEIDPRVDYRSDSITFVKSESDSFSNPQLEPFLRKQGIEKLIVMGVMAEGCVRATAVRPMKTGYRVVVVSDAVPSTAQWKKRLGFWAMRRAGAEYITADALCAP